MLPVLCARCGSLVAAASARSEGTARCPTCHAVVRLSDGTPNDEPPHAAPPGVAVRGALPPVAPSAYRAPAAQRGEAIRVDVAPDGRSPIGAALALIVMWGAGLAAYAITRTDERPFAPQFATHLAVWAVSLVPTLVLLLRRTDLVLDADGLRRVTSPVPSLARVHIALHELDRIQLEAVQIASAWAHTPTPLFRVVARRVDGKEHVLLDATPDHGRAHHVAHSLAERLAVLRAAP